MHPASSEQLEVLDYGDLSNEVWNVRTNLSAFPTVSSSYRITVRYDSGLDAKGAPFFFDPDRRF